MKIIENPHLTAHGITIDNNDKLTGGSNNSLRQDEHTNLT